MGPWRGPAFRQSIMVLQMHHYRGRGPPTNLLVGFVCAVVSVPFQPLRAQTLEGRVIDGSTEDPVAAAYVALVTGDRRSVVGITTEPDGSFSLDAPSPGDYYLYVSSIGYRPVTDGLFELGEGGSIEVEIRLEPDPVMMDSLRATVDRTERYLRQVGFYERREQGWGYQLTHEEVRRRAVMSVTDAIRDIPRVHVAEGAMAGYPSIVIRHGRWRCPPHIYVDGFFVHRGGLPGDVPPPDGPARPDEFVHPEDIAAIELYRSRAEAPAEYGMSGCGVLLIWTWH